jgi:hypothetical protein
MSCSPSPWPRLTHLSLRPAQPADAPPPAAQPRARRLGPSCKCPRVEVPATQPVRAVLVPAAIGSLVLVDYALAFLMAALVAGLIIAQRLEHIRARRDDRRRRKEDRSATPTASLDAED